jgi:hypothetical protein
MQVKSRGSGKIQEARVLASTADLQTVHVLHYKNSTFAVN